MIEKELYKLSLNAIKKNEVPIAAIIVKNNKIISKAINNKNSNNDVLGHAEIIAIRKAQKKLKSWILEDCSLYCTVEPCSMCEEVIKYSRIDKVYFYLNNPNKNTKNIRKICIENEYNKKYKYILQKFFKNLRK